jgi:multidrug efflux system outer membrane protein
VRVQQDEINLLIGKYIGPVPRNDSALEKFPIPEVPVGLPSTLLERRPDIRQAEQEFRSANAQVGVAVANYFPQLNLTGLLGRVSPELSAFTAGGANAWSMTAPIFQGGVQLYQALGGGWEMKDK